MGIRVPDETEGRVNAVLVLDVRDVRDLRLEQLLDDPRMGPVVDRIVEGKVAPATAPVAAFSSAI